MRALTAAEVAAFTGLDERSVRKDVEQGVVEAGTPPRFADTALVYFRARAAFAFALGPEDRRRLYALVSGAVDQHLAQLELGTGWVLDVEALAAEVLERIARFDRWKDALARSDDVLGGEVTFAGSRLAVRHVGAMLARGADPTEVHEDYPYLSQEDLEFARLYVSAYPRVGRPREQAPPR